MSEDKKSYSECDFYEVTEVFDIETTEELSDDYVNFKSKRLITAIKTKALQQKEEDGGKVEITIKFYPNCP